MTKADKKPTKVELNTSDKSEVEISEIDEEKMEKMSNSLSQSDTITETKESEPNNYAFNVLNRIRAKLEGTESKDGKLSVEKQVFLLFCFFYKNFFFQVVKLIEESTDVGNLSLMYEGWTAWL